MEENNAMKEFYSKLKSESSSNFIKFFNNNLINDVKLFHEIPYSPIINVEQNKEYYLNEFKKLVGYKSFSNVTIEKLEYVYNKSKDEFISEEEINWLNKDIRFVHYIWARIILMDCNFNGIKLSSNLISAIQMSTSSKEKNISIMNFIYDSYQITRSVKLLFINQWISEYNQQLRFVNIPRWIFEKEETTMDWVWGYLSKANDNPDYAINSFCTLSQLQSIFDISYKSTKKERYLVLIAILLLWGASLLQKKYLIKNIRKAYLQNKLRSERVNQSALSCYIEKDKKNMLVDMAEYFELPLNKMIEALIEGKYTEIFQDENVI
ncbi:hypothetical protein ACUVB7_002925 [Providencia rettgeri]